MPKAAALGSCTTQAPHGPGEPIHLPPAQGRETPYSDKKKTPEKKPPSSEEWVHYNPLFNVGARRSYKRHTHSPMCHRATEESPCQLWQPQHILPSGFLGRGQFHIHHLAHVLQKHQSPANVTKSLRTHSSIGTARRKTVTPTLQYYTPSSMPTHRE
jgi:hypothetical protein